MRNSRLVRQNWNLSFPNLCFLDDFHFSCLCLLHAFLPYSTFCPFFLLTFILHSFILSFLQLLWNLFTHCTVDIQKVTAISALCRLTCQAPAVFQHVIEKAGFKAVLASLSSGVTKVQQAAVTMFGTVLSTRPQARRLVQERDLIPKVMHLLESSSVVIRGKALLMVLTMVQVKGHCSLDSWLGMASTSFGLRDSTFCLHVVVDCLVTSWQGYTVSGGGPESVMKLWKPERIGHDSSVLE